MFHGFEVQGMFLSKFLPFMSVQDGWWAKDFLLWVVFAKMAGNNSLDHHHVYIYIYCYITPSISIYIYIYRKLFNFSTSVSPLLKATSKHTTIGISTSRLSINLWGQEGCNGAICSTRIQASSDDHQEARPENPKDFSEFWVGFPWMFRPPIRSSEIFFLVGYNKIPEVCVASGKSFREKHLDLGGCWSIQRVPGFPIEELIGSGEKCVPFLKGHTRKDQMRGKGGLSIKTTLYKGVFYGSCMTL